MRWPLPAEARSGVAVRSFLIPAFIPRLSPAGAIDAARKMIAGDTAIVVGTMLIQNMIRVVGSMILTRMLSAEAFGVIGVISSVAVTFGLLSDIGIVAFVVRHERSNERTFLDEVWTLRMIRSLLLTTACSCWRGRSPSSSASRSCTGRSRSAGCSSSSRGAARSAP